MATNEWRTSVLPTDLSCRSFIERNSRVYCELYGIDFHSLEDGELPDHDFLLSKTVASFSPEGYILVDAVGLDSPPAHMTLLFNNNGIYTKFPVKPIVSKKNGNVLEIKAHPPSSGVTLQQREYHRVVVTGWKGSFSTIQGMLHDVSYGGFSLITPKDVDIDNLGSLEVTIYPKLTEFNAQPITCTALLRRKCKVGAMYIIGFSIEHIDYRNEFNFSRAFAAAERLILRRNYGEF